VVLSPIFMRQAQKLLRELPPRPRFPDQESRATTR
jgi:hypothetical protein